MSERSTEVLTGYKTHDLFFAELSIARGLHEATQILEQQAQDFDTSVLIDVIKSENPVGELELANRAVSGYMARAEATYARMEAKKHDSEIFEKYLGAKVEISVLSPHATPIASMPSSPGPAEFFDDPRKKIKGTVLEVSAEHASMIIFPNFWAQVDGTRAYSVSLLDHETLEPNVYITFV